MYIKRLVGWLAAVSMLVSASAFASTRLMPFILGHVATGSMSSVVQATRQALVSHGFQIVGQYSVTPHATVICATDPALLSAAAHAKNGGFGAVQRVSVTNVQGKLQVSYVNPAYIGAAYGLGRLAVTQSAIEAALGDQMPFGSKRGLTRSDLKPGNYHYFFGMPYFENVDHIKKYKTYAQAVSVVQENLAKHVAGSSLVYEVTIPGTRYPTTVFGVGIRTGSGADARILHRVDVGPYKGTAYAPYEMMVVGRRIIALRPRYRIAINFPDTSMMGNHGFMSIMGAPPAIRHVLGLVAGRHD